MRPSKDPSTIIRLLRRQIDTCRGLLRHQDGLSQALLQGEVAVIEEAFAAERPLMRDLEKCRRELGQALQGQGILEWASSLPGEKLAEVRRLVGELRRAAVELRSANARNFGVLQRTAACGRAMLEQVYRMPAAEGYDSRGQAGKLRAYS